MHDVLAIVMVFSIPIIGIICGTLVKIIRITRGGSGESGSAQDETKMIQEMYQGFRKMEKRIEALETLILKNASREQDLEKAFRNLEE